MSFTKIKFVHVSNENYDFQIELGDFIIVDYLSYLRSTNYFKIIGGEYSFKLFVNSKVFSKKLLLSKLLILEGNRNYTLVIRGIKNIDIMLEEDNLDCVKEGKSHIRFIHASEKVNSVDVYYNNKIVHKNLSYGKIGDPSYYSFNSGEADISLTETGTIRVLAGPYKIDLESGAIYTMIVAIKNNKIILKISEDGKKNCILITK